MFTCSLILETLGFQICFAMSCVFSFLTGGAAVLCHAGMRRCWLEEKPHQETEPGV